LPNVKKLDKSAKINNPYTQISAERQSAAQATQQEGKMTTDQLDQKKIRLTQTVHASG
jgi:hypothetical protein